MFTVDPKVVEIEKMIKSFQGFKENNHSVQLSLPCFFEFWNIIASTILASILATTLIQKRFFTHRWLYKKQKRNAVFYKLGQFCRSLKSFRQFQPRFKGSE